MTGGRARDARIADLPIALPSGRKDSGSLWKSAGLTRLLLDREANADEAFWTAVHPAASRGNARMIHAVLETGGDTTRRDHEGFTLGDVAKAKALCKIAANTA